MKECPRCGENKSPADFYKNQKTLDGLDRRCKKCSIEINKNWIKNNTVKGTTYFEKYTTRHNNYKKNNPAVIKRHARVATVRSHGLSLEDYHKMFEEQRGRCAICRKHRGEFKIALAIDHDHKSGNVRGLLCRQCNLAIGYFKDNVEFVDRASAYLKRNNKKVI